MYRAVLTITASLICVSCYGAATSSLPVVVVEAENYAPDGKPRMFPWQDGYVKWSPRLPVYSGDLLDVKFSLSDGTDIREVRVFIDGKSLVRLTKPPWRVSLDTNRVKPGKHVITGEVRSRTEPIMYGTSKLVFHVQKPPETRVAGSVQELGGSGEPPMITAPPIDPDIRVKLRSLDPTVDRMLAEGGRVVITRPTTVYLEGDVQRWSYTILRNGEIVTSTGPMARRIYLELATKTAEQPGLLPGVLMLRVWGIRNDGVHSEPVDVTLDVR